MTPALVPRGGPTHRLPVRLFTEHLSHIGSQIKPLHRQNCLHGGGGSGGPGRLHDSVFTATSFPSFPGTDVDLHGCSGFIRDASTCNPSSPVN